MKLYPHQAEGVDWLCAPDRRNALLLDEQGLGKTITAICAAERLGCESILVLTPSVVLHNWRREFRAWSSYKVCLLDRVRSRIEDDAQVVVTTHGLIRRPEILTQLLARSWDLCIVDEVHCFRNRTAKYTRLLYTSREALVKRCARVWGLSGTIMPNNASELWTHLYALFPQSIDGMGFDTFRKAFCVLRPSAYGDGVKVVGNRNVEQLRKRLAGVALRRRERDVLNLPPMRFETVSVRPDQTPTVLQALEAELGEQITQLGLTQPAEILEALGDSVAMARYRRVCGVAKCKPAVELIASELEFDQRRKIVVFAHHVDVVETIAADLDKRFGATTITGSTTPAKRQRRIDLFQQRDSGPRVIVCNIVAGGVGSTLTAASEALFVEMDFVPGNNQQAAKRVHRIGQNESVRIRFLALDGSVDEWTTAALVRKTRMIQEVLK